MMHATRAIVLMVACLPALAQSNSTPQAGAYRIAGTVVNAVTGEAVRGATIAVLADADSRRIAETQSGSDGHFSIDGLAAAKYQLTASKRGYSTADYDEHEDYSSAIVVGAGQDTGSLVFRLVPGAVLRGVVTADGGDAVQDAQVMLFKKPQGHEPGTKIAQVDTATTDDTGAYEFDNLAAGEFLLAVKAAPWYAMHSASSRQRGAADANQALDVAYPITYFDSTTDEASASPIVLAGGSRVEADVSLHAVPALRLRMDAQRKQDGSFARPALTQYIFGSEVPATGAGVEFRDAGEGVRFGTLPEILHDDALSTSEFSGVAPGHYELTQGDPPRLVELDATSSQQVEPGVGVPAVAVSGALETANGAPYQGGAVVTLEPVDGATGAKAMVAVYNRGAFSFTGVAAGNWKVQVSTGLSVPVLSITLSGRTHAGNVVTVADRPVTLIARVNAGATRVEGFALKSGKGQAGVMVVLVPRGGAGIPELVRRDQSDSDGSFSLRDVAPGQYTVVAIEDGWGLDWARPEVIGRYLPGGVAVTVTYTSDQVVRLSGPVAVQAR